MTKDIYGLRGEALIRAKKKLVATEVYLEKAIEVYTELLQSIPQDKGRRILNSMKDHLIKQLNRIKKFEERINKAYIG